MPILVRGGERTRKGEFKDGSVPKFQETPLANMSSGFSNTSSNRTPLGIVLANRSASAKSSLSKAS